MRAASPEQCDPHSRVQSRPCRRPESSSSTTVNWQETHFLGMKAKPLNSFTIQFYLLTNKFKILGSSCISDLVLPHSLTLSLGEQHTFPSHTLALESPQQPCEVGVTTISLPAIPCTDREAETLDKSCGGSGSAWSLTQGPRASPGPTGFSYLIL